MSVIARPVPQWIFGNRVRKVRRELRLSQAEPAVRLGACLCAAVGTSTVGSWEPSNSKPPDRVASARAPQDITGIPAEWFLGPHPQE